MEFVGFYFHRGMDEGSPRVYADTISGFNNSPYEIPEACSYLLNGHPILDVTEITTDIIDSAFRVPGGSSILTDGSFAWRLDLASYVEHYAVNLPQHFLEHIESNGYHVPRVDQHRLIEISLLVSRELGFRTDAGAGPRTQQ